MTSPIVDQSNNIIGNPPYYDPKKDDASHMFGELPEKKPKPVENEKAQKINIDAEEGAWLRVKGKDGQSLGRSSEPSDGVFALPEKLTASQKRKGFIGGEIEAGEENAVSKAIAGVRRAFDNFMVGINNIYKRNSP